MPRFARRRRNSRLLKMGTGTVHSTAISTVAITAVIFSFVERLMASSERDAQRHRRPIRGRSCLRCDGDHAPTGCLTQTLLWRKWADRLHGPDRYAPVECCFKGPGRKTLWLLEH